MDNGCWHCVHRDNFETLICGNCVEETGKDGQSLERTFFKDRGDVKEQTSKFELGIIFKQIVEKYPTMIAEAMAQSVGGGRKDDVR